MPDKSQGIQTLYYRQQDLPVYGNWSNIVTVDIPVRGYPRIRLHGDGLSLQAELLGEEPTASGSRQFLFTVAVGRGHLPGSPEFESNLVFDLNLLCESVGAVGVFPVGASPEEYLETVFVNWHLLPSGRRDIVSAVIDNRIRRASVQNRRKFLERYDFIKSLGPQRFIVGSQGFSGYFGAIFAGDVVVFDNIDSGNAIYVFGSDWEQLSRLTKTELLRDHRDRFSHVVHSEDGTWRERLRTILEDRLGGLPNVTGAAIVVPPGNRRVQVVEGLPEDGQQEEAE